MKKLEGEAVARKRSRIGRLKKKWKNYWSDKKNLEEQINEAKENFEENMKNQEGVF